MIVWPLTSRSPIVSEQEDGRDHDSGTRPTVSGVSTMRTTSADDLEPEAAEPRAALRVERRALVLDGARVDRPGRPVGRAGYRTGGVDGVGSSVAVGRSRAGNDTGLGRRAPAHGLATIRPMAPDRTSDRPSAASRFGWHPEPGLIGVDDEATSREALEALGRAAWDCRARLPVRRGVPPGGRAADRLRRPSPDVLRGRPGRAT